MEGFVDIHSHILPGLDDGAKSPEETGKMLQLAYQEGIRAIIATPHFFSGKKSASPERIKEVVFWLREKLADWNLPLELYTGNEIFYQSEVPDRLEAGEICTLAGSRYVLVEFHPMTEYAYLRDGIWKLLSYGYYPILAHAERYECLFQKKERLEEIKEQGSCIQVNASSFLAGLFQERSKRAGYMLKKELVDFVATDAHSMGQRSPHIRQCFAYIRKKVGRQKAETILIQNPKAIFQDRRL